MYRFKKITEIVTVLVPKSRPNIFPSMNPLHLSHPPTVQVIKYAKHILGLTTCIELAFIIFHLPRKVSSRTLVIFKYLPCNTVQEDKEAKLSQLLVIVSNFINKYNQKLTCFVFCCYSRAKWTYKVLSCYYYIIFTIS